MTDTPDFHILLVEDDKAHAEITRIALEESGVPVAITHVWNGVEAINFLRRKPPHEQAPRPDLVLLDLRLPRMDGHAVLKTIKRDEQLLSIPVVVLTTSDAEIDRCNAFGACANSYIVKPVDFTEFAAMAKSLVGYWSQWNARVSG